MRCESCQGIGFLDHEYVVCPECQGSGVAYCCDQAGANPPNVHKSDPLELAVMVAP